MHARLGRRHAHHAEKGRELDLEALGPADAVRQLPMNGMVTASVHDAPGSGVDRLDLDDERLAGLRAANEDRAGERVALVQLGAPRGEALVAGDVPRVIGREELDGVAGVDLDRRLEVLREVPVQVSLLERKLVRRH